MAPALSNLTEIADAMRCLLLIRQGRQRAGSQKLFSRWPGRQRAALPRSPASPGLASPTTVGLPVRSEHPITPRAAGGSRHSSSQQGPGPRQRRKPTRPFSWDAHSTRIAKPEYAARRSSFSPFVPSFHEEEGGVTRQAVSVKRHLLSPIGDVTCLPLRGVTLPRPVDFLCLPAGVD